MSVRMDTEKCVGCGRCAAVCPGNLLYLAEDGGGHKKIKIRDRRDCWSCTACLKECPKDALFLTLEASLGGAGGWLYADDSPERLTWRFAFAGTEQRIEVQKNQANAY